MGSPCLGVLRGTIRGERVGESVASPRGGCQYFQLSPLRSLRVLRMNFFISFFFSPDHVNYLLLLIRLDSDFVYTDFMRDCDKISC